MNSFNHLWLPFTCSKEAETSPPLLIERGDGLYVFDDKGGKYIDAIGSWWVSILGHNNPRISAAVKKQLDKIEHVMMAGCITQPVLELTELLSGLAPDNLTKIFYSDDGSTSVEIALKIAIQYWAQKKENRTDFISFTGGYHGDTLGAMSVGCIPSYHKLFHERFKKNFFADSPYCYRCPCEKDKTTCKAECMDSLENLLEEKANTVAACIFEPMVQGAVGMRVYPAKVLRRIFDLCKKHNVLTIADEVAMGFGRTGKLFACEHSGASPDIMCVAKGLTGGYLPLAATITTEDIYRQFCGDFSDGREFQHGHTFTGNPLAASAAVETLSIIIERNIPESLNDIMAYFHKRIHEIFSDIDIVGDIRSIGMIGALELVKNRATKEKLPPEKRITFKIARKALEYNLLIRPLGDILYFMPAYCITGEEIDKMFMATRRAIEDIYIQKI